jgi:hypothetical protein
MIKIEKNQNFKEWLNIKVFGKLVNNVKSRSHAMHIAHQLQHDHKKQTGETLQIVNS